MDSCNLFTVPPCTWRRCQLAALLAFGVAPVLAQTSYDTPPDASGIHRYVAPSHHPAALKKALDASRIKGKTPPPTEGRTTTTHDRLNHLPVNVVTGPAVQAGHYRLVPLSE